MKIESKIVQLKQREKELKEILIGDLKKVKGRIDQAKKVAIITGLASLFIYSMYRVYQKGSQSNTSGIKNKQKRRSAIWKRISYIATPYAVEAIVRYVSKRTRTNAQKF